MTSFVTTASDRVRATGSQAGGGERPIVLVHGLLLGRKHNYPLADALADRGNRVILIDLLATARAIIQSTRATTRWSSSASRSCIARPPRHRRGVIGGHHSRERGPRSRLHAHKRTRALFVEMPVLERAAPAAGVMSFRSSSPTPSYGRRSVVRQRHASGPARSLAVRRRRLDVLSREPVTSARSCTAPGRTHRASPGDREKIDHPR